MKQSHITLYLFAIFAPLLLLTGACSQTEIELAKVANQALSQLTANKALSEQFVKDVKGNLEPTDPDYQQIMGSYEQARDVYNEYIRSIQVAVRSGKAPSLPSESLEQLNNAGTNFLRTAAKGIDRNVDRRGLQFDKALVIPELGPIAKKLSGDARSLLSDRMISDVTWKPWSQIQP